jgi:Zn-dependent peptidase ImmA (M78 family)
MYFELGECIFSPQLAIRIDPSLLALEESPRFRFTLAHELGHMSLHRNLPLDFQSLDASQKAIIDSEHDVAPEPRELKTPRDWLEWQANSYAAALLMPQPTVGDEIARVQAALGIARNLGRIRLDGQRATHRGALCCVSLP